MNWLRKRAAGFLSLILLLTALAGCRAAVKPDPISVDPFRCWDRVFQRPEHAVVRGTLRGMGPPRRYTPPEGVEETYIPFFLDVETVIKASYFGQSSDVDLVLWDTVNHMPQQGLGERDATLYDLQQLLGNDRIYLLAALGEGGQAPPGYILMNTWVLDTQSQTVTGGSSGIKVQGMPYHTFIERVQSAASLRNSKCD